MSKFVLGEKGAEEALLKKVQKKDYGYQIERIIQSNSTRIRNHSFEISKINKEIDAAREDFRYWNSMHVRGLSEELRRNINIDQFSAKLQSLSKWKKHLRKDIKYLENQITFLGGEMNE